MDDSRREQAIARLKKKREFWSHLFVYVVVNAMLVGIWAMSGTDYFWPIWSIGGWGIGVVFHAFDTFRGVFSEAAIQREMERGR